MIRELRRSATLTLIDWSQTLMRLALLICPTPDVAEKRRVLAAYDKATAHGDVRNWQYFKDVVGEPTSEQEGGGDGQQQ